jgi:hypothetical protein
MYSLAMSEYSYIVSADGRDIRLPIINNKALMINAIEYVANRQTSLL